MIETPPIDMRAAERMHRRARDIQIDYALWRSRMDQAKRAATARDPRLLKVLEGTAETLERAREEQLGRTQRSSSAEFGLRVPPTEVVMWREAYRLVDQGEFPSQFTYLITAAAEFAGLVA